MKILNSVPEDIPEIFRLYRLATEYQKEKFPENQWPRFSLNLVETEIAEARQFKIVIDNKIACIWAITFTDPQIWEEKNKDPAVYIHRIATNPEFRGRNFVVEIAKWARDFAFESNKKYIRMDTCNLNSRLIQHYTNCGFKFLEIKKLNDYTGLPEHYIDADVCFFEIEL